VSGSPLNGQRDSPAGGEAAGGEPPLPAGDFASWLAQIQRAVRGTGGSEVPCAGCTACCRSGQFVHVEPDESDALAHIPGELLFPAPGRPEGHRVLATTGEGHCPMLVDDRCSIYEHRPRACRTYDCRIFTATGVDVGPGQPEVGRRVARWRFTFGSDADRVGHDACRAAATFLDRRRDLWTDRPPSANRLAAGAVAVHDLFQEEGGGGLPASVTAAPIAPKGELTGRLAGVSGSGKPLRRRAPPGRRPW
jgi:hypothetical protein